MLCLLVVDGSEHVRGSLVERQMSEAQAMMIGLWRFDTFTLRLILHNHNHEEKSVTASAGQHTRVSSQTARDIP